MTEKTATRKIEEARRAAGFPLPTYSVAPMRAGSDSAELRPEPGGYWTPAHIAQEQIDMRDEELQQLRKERDDLRTALDSCAELRKTLTRRVSHQNLQISDLRDENERLKDSLK